MSVVFLSARGERIHVGESLRDSLPVSERSAYTLVVPPLGGCENTG